MERLSGLDSAFLSLETPSMHLHVASLSVLDTSTMRVPYDFEWLKRFICRRLTHLERSRKRVVPVPFHLNHPIWVEDPHFDENYHIRRHVLPPPGGDAELAELAGSIVGIPLDRTRPLWEIHVIEGLSEPGYIALIGKIHHCAVDGVSGAELFVHLFDLSPDAEDIGEAEPPKPERIPSEVEMMTHAVWSQARRSLSLPGLLGRTARTAGQLVQRHRNPEAVVGAVPLKAPRTEWNAVLTPHRRVAFASVDLDQIKAVKNAAGVKVNDVVLALVTLAVRRYLEERDGLPDSPLVAMCPVSVRTEDERGQFDNRVSAMFVHLHTDIAEATRGAKEDHNAVGAKLLQNWAEHAAPATFALAMRLYMRLNLVDRLPPIYNLIVSNVPGPPVDLYMAGARLVHAFPIGPVSEGAGLNVTVLSHADVVDFGFLACAELVPDLAVLAGHVTDAMEDLAAAAGNRAAGSRLGPSPQGGTGRKGSTPGATPAT
jgi:diacylglycerol O-acyltransferase / wax synthase